MSKSTLPRQASSLLVRQLSDSQVRSSWANKRFQPSHMRLRASTSNGGFEVSSMATSAGRNAYSQQTWSIQQALEQSLMPVWGRPNYQYDVLTKEFFEGMFLRACVRPNDLLDSILRRLRALHLHSLSTTMVYAINVALLATVALTTLAAVGAASFYSNALSTDFTRLRFSRLWSAHGFHGGDLSILQSLKHRIKLSGPTCSNELWPNVTMTEVTSEQAIVMFDESSSIRAWSIGKGSGMTMTEVYKVEAWDGDKWTGVGSGHYEATFFGTVVAIDKFCGIDGCSAKLAPLWTWLVTTACLYSVLAVTGVLALAQAAAGRTSAMITSIRRGLAVCVGLLLVAAVGNTINENVRLSVFQVASALCLAQVIWVFGTARRWSTVVHNLVIVDGIYLAAVLIDRSVRHDLGSMLLTGEVYVFVIGVVILIRISLQRKLDNVALRKRLRSSCNGFQREWDELKKEMSEQNPTVWNALSSLTHVMTDRSSARQTYPRFLETPASFQTTSAFERTSSRGDGMAQKQSAAAPDIEGSEQSTFFEGSAHSFVFEILRPQQSALALVESLDQLYLIASTVYPFHLKKVKELAQQSNAWLARRGLAARTISRVESDLTTKDEGTLGSGEDGCSRVPSSVSSARSKYVQWSDVEEAGDENHEAAFFVPMKSFERSLNKIHEVYDGDVSRLTDIVRQELVYESLDDLIRCLTCIRSDPEIAIERIKDTMSSDAEAEASAECRHIKINFRICNGYTRGLGVSHHVCELLLSLKRLHTIKASSDIETHYRFRKARASDRYDDRTWLPFHFTSLAKGRWFRKQQAAAMPDTSGGGGWVATPDMLLNEICREDSSHSERTLMKMLLDRHLSSLRIPAGGLDAEANDPWSAFAKSNFRSVWLMENPLLGIMCKWKSLAIVVLAATVYFLDYTVLNFGAYLSLFQQTGARFRFTVIETRNGSSTGSAAVSEVGMTLNDCLLPANNFSAVGSGIPQYLMSFENQISFNGWYFVTSNRSSPALDPMRFQIEVQESEDDEWKVIGSSKSYQTRIDELGHQLSRLYLRELPKLQTVKFWLGPHWSNFAAWTILSSVVLVAIVAEIRAFWAENLDDMLNNFALAALGIASSSMVHIVGDLTDDRPGIMIFYHAVPLVVWTSWFYMVFARQDKYLVEVSLGLSLFYLVREALLQRIVYAGEWSQMIDYGQLGVFVILICVKGLQIHTVYKCKWTGQGMFAAHEKQWVQLIENAEERSSLEKLKGIVKPYDSIETGRVRQKVLCWHCLHETQGLLNPSFWIGAKLEAPDSNQTVALTHSVSLDQLFAQAQALFFILRQKVHEWGRLSNAIPREDEGLNPLPFGDLTPESSQPHSPGSPKIGRTSIKSTMRIMQKLYRCYNTDKSLLLDICRAGLVFESSSNMVRALQALVSDPEIRILRVKNTMDPSKPPGTLGYRQVLLNFQMVTPLSERLGLSMHVAELQLTHIVFARMKASIGHDLYKTWRDLRGA